MPFHFELVSPEKLLFSGDVASVSVPGSEGDFTVLAQHAPMMTRDILLAMNKHIKASLRYEAREAEGTQGPVETLSRGAGTCRDFALLLMEAVRSLGFAARFVSGYIQMAEGAYQNGGLWDWWGGAQITAEFEHGLRTRALKHLYQVADDWLKHPRDIYEWQSPRTGFNKGSAVQPAAGAL